MISIVGTGIIFRNPKPHVRSVHAYFPSIARLPNGDLVASVALAQAFEAADMRTHLFRSTDEGDTWVDEGLLYPGTTDRHTSDVSRLTALTSGELVALTARHDRTEHLDDGLTNPDNLGFVPTEFLLFRSDDGGHSWDGPDTIHPPLVGPSFELCCPITPLRSGSWLLPTSTWQGWDGSCPNGIRTVIVISNDKGCSWPEWRDVFHHRDRRVHYWESKVVELEDGRLLAAAWAYDADAGHDEPNAYAISPDQGNSWTEPYPTGLHGQTLALLVLRDDRVLTVYRRTDIPGLWATLVRLDGSTWLNEETVPLWGAQVSGLTSHGQNMSANFAALRFGAPSVIALPNGDVFAAFWCYEDYVSVIRWYRLRVD